MTARVGVLAVCMNNCHSGVSVNIEALAGGGTARHLVSLDALVVNGVEVHPRKVFRMDVRHVVDITGLDEDDAADVFLDLVCNNDDCVDAERVTR